VDRQRAAQRATQARQWWRQSSSEIGDRLPILFARLARLDQLDRNFASQLETEKLEAMAEFAAGAGHEINNPLAVISGRAQLLMRDELDPGRRRELAVIHAQAMRVHEMISDLMLFARPPRPRIGKFSLSKCLDKLLSELEPQLAARQVRVERGSGMEGLILSADGAQVIVALKAICQNAISAIGPGGVIRITAETSANPRLAAPQVTALEADNRAAGGEESAWQWVRIDVADDGPGIGADVRRHLFDPFYCGRGAGRGLGLGLSKCWRVISNHGGTVEVDSEPGRGACFRVFLPGSRAGNPDDVIAGG
jgi:signal transduction histidine kinase